MFRTIIDLAVLAILAAMPLATTPATAAHQVGQEAAVTRPEPSNADWELLFPEADGKSYVTALCGSCHTLKSIVLSRHDAAGWRAVMSDMNRQGAPLDREDIAIMVEYLTEYFGAEHPPLELPLNLNTADLPHLGLLPQLTRQEQEKLLQARTKKPFRDLADLRPLLSEEKIAKIKPFVAIR